MGNVQEMFADERLLQGAPFLPTKLVEEKSVAKAAATDTGPSATVAKVQPTATESGGVSGAKAALKEVLTSDWTQELLESATNIAETAQAGIKIVEQVLALTRERMKKNPGAAGYSSARSELVPLWELMEQPEFQQLVALLLAKTLQ
ncbi:MAG TPA: hypothetical protein VJ036_05625 [bacterium]|jgi:hypothetical protein|nr:hypothetical protein [bacterium]